MDSPNELFEQLHRMHSLFMRRMGSRMLEAHKEFIAECKEMLTDKWTGGLSSGASTTADSTVFQLPVPQVALPGYGSPVTNSLIAKLHEAVGHIHTVSPFLEGDDVFFKIQEVEMHFRLIWSDVSLAGRLNALAAHMKVEHVANNKSCLVDWVRKEIKTLNLLSRDIFVLACCAQIDTTASQQHIKVAFTAVAQDTCFHYNNAGIPTDKFPLWCNTLWQLFQRHAETRAA